MLAPPPVMLTRPKPIGNPGAHSPISRRIAFSVLEKTLGEMLEFAALTTDSSTAELAEWAGHLLLKWADDERLALLKQKSGEV